MIKVKVQEARQKALELMSNPDEPAYALRSCWNCNGAHEYLKEADYVIHCAWDCGHWFYKGIDITEDETDEI